MYVFQAAGGSLATPTRYAAGSSGIALADFNQDGSIDAVATCGFDPCPASASELATYANNGDGTFAGPFVLNTIYTPAGVTAADFSGDGRPDIIEVIPQVSDSKFTQYTNTTP